MRRLQRFDKDFFFQKAVDTKVEAKRLKAEAYTTDEVIKAFC